MSGNQGGAGMRREQDGAGMRRDQDGAGMRRRAAVLLPLALGGCSFLDSIFGETKDKLPGKREAVTTVRRGLEVDPSRPARVTVPAAVAVPSWPQPGGGPTHATGNVAVQGFERAWRSSIGEGGGYRAKVTGTPIVFNGQVATMDSDGVVALFSLENGSRAWRRDTQGDEDRSTNVGGGVSWGPDGGAAGTIFATTGRGEVLALDPATGTIRWRKPLESPARSAPTVANGRLFVVTLNDKLQAFSATTGERIWSYQAAAAPTTLFGQAAPAVSDGLVVAGFGSGELVCVREDSGALAWSDSLASARGRGTLSELSGVRSMPVIDRGRVFAIGGGGLMVGLDLRSGRRLWEREIGGLQTPWLAGDWLYVQTGDQTLAAIGREDGRVAWINDLPRYEDPQKRRDPLFWAGPAMAAGKLILGGSSAEAGSFDPVTGNLLGRIKLSDAIAVAPVAVAGTLLLVTDDGYMQAFR